MKKLLSLILVLTAILTLTACSNINEDEETLKRQACALIEKSLILNNIYWGKGLSPLPGEQKLSYDHNYSKADVSQVEKYGITNMQTLKEYTQSVYTQNECDNIFGTYLTQSSYTGTFGEYTYTEVYTRYLSDMSGDLFVREKKDDLIGDSIVEYDYDSVRIKKIKRNTVEFEIDVTVKNSDDETGYRETLPLQMRKENGSFRLNTPTYCVYDKR